MISSLRLAPLLLFLTSICFGAKPIDPSAWTALPIPSTALPAGFQKIEGWKNIRSGCVVTILRADGIHDPKEAIGCAGGLLGGLFKKGVYPTNIYRERDCPFPNVVLAGLFSSRDVPCRFQLLFGAHYVQSITVMLPPEKFVLFREFDFEDTADTLVAKELNAYAEADHQKFLADMQTLVAKLRALDASGK
jgi:hypothetical protein